MSLVKGKVNPLNVLGVRKLSFMPKHFNKLSINPINIDLIDKWVYTNLNSRYAIVKMLTVDSANKLEDSYVLGIEDSRELTLFSLTNPHIEKH